VACAAGGTGLIAFCGSRAAEILADIGKISHIYSDFSLPTEADKNIVLAADPQLNLWHDKKPGGRHLG
jgi:hypothetical protein